LEAVQAFFAALVDQVVPVASCAEAEMTKLLENTFRHVNIALVNELARFSADLGVDIWRVIDAASTKPFGFMRFTPGPGVGGHCLPIDPSYLAWQVRQRSGQPFRFVELANDINDHMPDYVVDRVVRMLNDECKPVKGSHIVALGLSYKANSSDWRESPSLAVIRKLRALGAQVTVCDPAIPGSTLIPDDMTITAVDDIGASVDLAVILTAHDLFDWDWVARSFPLILDTRNILRDRDFRGERL
jgi:UDP-N-acetyl-D-mannosaminuronic acid dehydrogenase/UDP-N-acetyl-D-glucosamine dehydrogenase